MNPSGASLPAHELSAANTMVWPRPRRMSASPMHWFVGPYADSGQNMMVSDGGVVTGDALQLERQLLRDNGFRCIGDRAVQRRHMPHRAVLPAAQRLPAR